MATGKQMLATRKFLENPGISWGEAMREAGYSPNTAHNPKDLTESKGFIEMCEEAGLTPQFVTVALVQDIKSKPKRRLGELALAAKILRMENQGAGEERFKNPVQLILEMYNLHVDGDINVETGQAHAKPVQGTSPQAEG